MNLNRGFTLLEMLVVMLLIGLVIGIVSLVPNSTSSSQARREAKHFTDLLDLLRQQAVAQNQVYGVNVNAQSYEVLWLDGDGRWQPSPDFRRQLIPGTLRLRLDLTPTVPAPATAKPPASVLKAVGQQPDVLVLPSDETSPYTAWIESDGKSLLTITSDGLDEVHIEAVQ